MPQKRFIVTLSRAARKQLLLAALLFIPCALWQLGYAQDKQSQDQTSTAKYSPQDDASPTDAVKSPGTPGPVAQADSVQPSAKQDSGTAAVSGRPETAKPVLKPSSKQAAPQELVKKLLDANRNWLRPDPQHLSYTFSMEHPGKADRTQVEVEYTAPNQVTVQRENLQPYNGLVDDKYEPDNSAYPPQRTTLLQGVTLFGPLQELAMSQEGHALSVVGEETIDGIDAWVLHLKAEGKPSEEALKRWDERLRRQASRQAKRSKYFYEFTPVQKDVDGKPRAVMELKCVYEEGPGWKELAAAHDNNPAEIRWGGYKIEAVIREYRGQIRPVIVLNRDSEAETKTPVASVSFLEGGVDNVTPKLGLGEGEQIFDEALFQKLKAESKEPEIFLPMRVGCGIFGSWYGYSGGGADVDQLWVDKATGRILREEGFYKAEPRFVVDYGGFEPISDNGQTPRQITVRLLSAQPDKTYPWVLQMEFQLLDGKAWLLKELKESQGERQNVAIAAVTNARVSAANGRETQNQPVGEAAVTKPAAPDMIVESVGWKDVRVGMKREDLIKALGSPDNDPSANVLKWTDKHIDCTFHTGSLVVSEVRFNEGFSPAIPVEAENGIK